MFGLNPWVIIAIGIAFAVSNATSYITGKDVVQTEWRLEKAAAKAAAVDEGAKQQSGADRAAITVAAATTVAVERIVTETVYINREIPTYVPDTSHCITVGLIRVLDAAARGSDPAAAALAPGQFNETCAGIGSRALAESIVGNYGTARANAAQLTGLQGYVCEVRRTLRPDAPATERCP